MKVSIIQTSTKWLKPEENRKSAQDFINNNSGSDIYILGEMFTTGFSVKPEQSAESNEETLIWLKKMAAEKNATIGGSVSVEDNGKYFNRFYMVKPDGTYSKYDKRHLFSYAGEHKEYESGNERVIIEVEGVRILLLVCYDLRFPVWSRNLGDYDMIAYVANWPKKRRFAWDTLLRARAIENQCYVCGVNIVGSNPPHEYSGGTAGVDFLGGTIADVADNVEGVATFNIDMEALRAFRAEFPVLDDADTFTINK